MTINLLIFTFGIVLVALSPTAVILFLATELAGAGLSLYPIARITALSDLYSDRLGRALGITMATGDISQTVLPLIAGVLTVALAVWLTVPKRPPSESEVDTLSVESLRSVVNELRKPTLLLVGLILFLYMLVWQMFSAFYPTYLINVKVFTSGRERAVQFVFRRRSHCQANRWDGLRSDRDSKIAPACAQWVDRRLCGASSHDRRLGTRCSDCSH
jgi:ACS family hexuronate transporter-like MFS transporter